MTGMPAPGPARFAAAALFFWACHAIPASAAPPVSAAPPASAAPPSPAAPDDAALCQGAIAAVEQRLPLPRRLLSAIAMIESGRAMPGGRAAAWPWTINVGGVGTFYDTAEAAIAAAETLRGNGVRSFDVGCMQINLMHHPAAFASLRDAFDPALNASYAARFLGELHAELGDWSRTVAAYHSRTETGADYQRKVVRLWPDAAAYGVVALLPSTVAGLVPTAPSLGNARAERDPEFGARLRAAAADHAALTRRIVGNGPATGWNPAGRNASRPLRLAQGEDGRGSSLRR